MPKSRLEESDMPKPYSNRAMPSDEPCNLGHHDHTDSPAYKTPDAVDHRDAPVDDDPIIKYLPYHPDWSDIGRDSNPH